MFNKLFIIVPEYKKCRFNSGTFFETSMVVNLFFNSPLIFAYDDHLKQCFRKTAYKKARQ